MYALVLESDGIEVLIDPRDLWRPPRVTVRRGYVQAEVWLDEDGVSFIKPPKVGRRDEEHILKLVRENLDDLLTRWCTLKDDVLRGRLERNTLVE